MSKDTMFNKHKLTLIWSYDRWSGSKVTHFGKPSGKTCRFLLFSQ